MRRITAVLTGAVALSAAFTSQAVAAPAVIDAPNARAAAEVGYRGELLRQKNVVDSFQVAEGLYCVIVDPNAGINLPSALILGNAGGHATNVHTIGQPTTSCNGRRDAITVVTLKDNLPKSDSFTIAVL
ncbi:hypothetical protein ACFU7Y_03350 [Kitasatospora sp. NPDC057542]|uniref:hypothetical protein n=1 Tax=Kitasatospora sp. NPDC057542 TaxID=3346162 RepID=UPI0036942253